MIRRWYVPFVLLIVLSTSRDTSAEVPDNITFVARLVNNGEPYAGPAQLTLMLYRNQSSGPNVWAETQMINVEKGFVSTQIGMREPIDEIIVDGGELFLEIVIDGTTLAPRLPIGSVPYAMMAGRSSRLGRLTEGDVQRKITGSCPIGSGIRSIDPDTGVTTCELDDDTRYTFGTGISESNGAVSIDTSLIQRRVGDCALGSSIRAIAPDGSVTCEIDTDTNTTYSANCTTGQFVRTLASNGTATCGSLAPLEMLTAASIGGIVTQTTSVARALCVLTHVESGGQFHRCNLIPNANGTWTLTANSGNTTQFALECRAHCL